MDDIQDIFDESTESKTENLVFSEDGNYNLNGRPFMEDSETGRISTLSELFTEWYLFDSSHEKNIQQFLAEEGLTDVFTESEFIDLICGNAYLDKELVYFVQVRIPFDISLEKLKHINSQHIKEAYLIRHNKYIIEKTKEIITQHTAIRKANLKASIKKSHAKYRATHRAQLNEYNKRYYAAHPEHAKERSKEYYNTHKATIKKNKAKYRATHREQINEYDRKYRAAHIERLKEREAQYRATHKEQKKQRDKIYYEINKEKIHQKQKEHYAETRDQCLARSRKYYAEHKEQYRIANKERYQKNKDKRKIQQRQYHAKQKQIAEAAKTVCAAYVFLLNLRKTDKEQYALLYTRQQKPLTEMIKTCAALQNMDIKMCPFCNDKCEQTPEQCCNQKVLALDNAKTMLKVLANMLKQR